MHNLRRLCAPGRDTGRSLAGAKRGGKGGIAIRRIEAYKGSHQRLQLRDAREVKCAGVEAGFASAMTRSLTLPSGKSFHLYFLFTDKFSPPSALAEQR